jgi:hypothetical protein
MLLQGLATTLAVTGVTPTTQGSTAPVHGACSLQTSKLILAKCKNAPSRHGVNSSHAIQNCNQQCSKQGPYQGGKTITDWHDSIFTVNSSITNLTDFKTSWTTAHTTGTSSSWHGVCSKELQHFLLAKHVMQHHCVSNAQQPSQLPQLPQPVSACMESNNHADFHGIGRNCYHHTAMQMLGHRCLLTTFHTDTQFSKIASLNSYHCAQLNSYHCAQLVL